MQPTDSRCRWRRGNTSRSFLDRRYCRVSVLDVSATVLAVAKGWRRGLAARRRCEVPIPTPPPRLWHDRAVFHFLTHPKDRAAYVRQAARAIKRGGYVIVATFGPEGS